MKIKKMSKNLIEKYYKFLGLSTFFIFFVYKIQNIQNVNILYGDDSWVVVGSSYSNFIEKLLCCSITFPGISLLHQLLFQIVQNTTIYLLIVFFISCGLMLYISLSENNDLEPKFKILFLLLLYSSPMLNNYSIRSKPYIFEAIVAFYLLIVLNKTIKDSKFESKYLFLFGLFVFMSLTTIIPIFALLIVLIKRDLLKIKHSKLGLTFIFFSAFFTSIYGFLKRSDELESFWVAYYAPTEGGFILFFRWLFYSFIRILSESNKLDLGATSFSILISTILIFLGILYVLKNKQKRYQLEFIILIFVINLILSTLKLFPFGGSRVNIYYMILVIYLIVLGISFIYEKLKFNNFVVTIFIMVTVFYAFSLPINYFQTTRFFNQNAAKKVIEFVNTSNENIVIYHGGVWTIGSYINEPLYMEKKGLNFSGSGVSNHPIPIFNKDSLYVPCTKYKTTGHCKDIIKNFLNSHNSKIYYLAAIHIREYQYQEYLDAFEELGFIKSVLVSDVEVELLKFEK